MKNLLPFFILFGFPSLLFAQAAIDYPQNTLFKVQGGYLYEKDNQIKFSGFNTLTVGLAKMRAAHKMEGIDLNVIAYKTKTGGGTSPTYPSRTKLSAEVDLYKSYLLFGKLKNGIYLGPLISGGFAWNKTTPNTSLAFGERLSGATVGLGLKANYFLKLSEKIFLTISSKMTILDFYLGVQQVENPSLPIRQQRNQFFSYNFLRNQIPISLGLTIPLGS